MSRKAAGVKMSRLLLHVILWKFDMDAKSLELVLFFSFYCWVLALTFYSARNDHKQ